MPITICFTYFKSLTLSNLRAALYSIRRQDLFSVEEILILDNSTSDPTPEIQSTISDLRWPVPVRLLSEKHEDSSRTHSWSTNRVVRDCKTEWIFFSRADYLLDFDMLQAFAKILSERPADWNGFITSNGCHLANTVEECEGTAWREKGPQIFSGAVFDYTKIDAGVWMARKDTFDRIGGMDESLSAWGHAQTEFQHRMWKAGTDFVRIPQVLFFHPFHGAPRDINVAHSQLAGRGINLKEMWSRYEGVSPY